MPKPNILLLLTDDQRHDTIGALGNSRVRTPHLDRLVAQGCAFERCHIMGGSAPAVCMPSRAMMHTGRGLFELHERGSSIPKDHTMLGEHLKTEGYTCYGTGKWHNGRDSFNRSFDDGGTIFFGGMADHWNVPCHNYDPTGAYEGRGRTLSGAHSTTRISQQAVELIRNHDQQTPFFCSVAFLAPHDPRTMPEEFRRYQMNNPPPLPANLMPEHPFDHGDLGVRDELLADLPRRPEQIQEHLAEYYAMIDHLDHNIGRILQELEKKGIADNTIIIVSGDNGLALGQHGLMGKQSCYDHSLRVPLIIAGPGIPRGARRNQLCYLHDIFPTICEGLGIGTPQSTTSVSLWPSIVSDHRHRNDLYCGYRQGIRSLTRDDGWKLIYSNGADGIQREQLYFTPEDPLELNNKAGEETCQAVLAELRTAFREGHDAAKDQWAPLDQWQGVPA